MGSVWITSNSDPQRSTWRLSNDQKESSELKLRNSVLQPGCESSQMSQITCFQGSDANLWHFFFQEVVAKIIFFPIKGPFVMMSDDDWNMSDDDQNPTAGNQFPENHREGCSYVQTESVQWEDHRQGVQKNQIPICAMARQPKQAT